MVTPLCSPQWPGSADFSTQYPPPQLCEALNNAKSSAAKGSCSHRLILAEQMAVTEEAVLMAIGFLDHPEEPWEVFPKCRSLHTASDF